MGLPVLRAVNAHPADRKRPGAALWQASTSERLQAQIKHHCRPHSVGFTGQHHGTDHVYTRNERVPTKVFAGISLEHLVCCEVKLRDQWLVAARVHEVMHKLGDAIRGMAWQ